MSTAPDPIRTLRCEAVAWTAGGPAKPLVDAAAAVVAETNLDSPSLVMLAGATAVEAERDAETYARRAFVEQGWVLADRRSEAAVVAFGRVRAWEFLQASAPPSLFDAEPTYHENGSTPAQFAHEMYDLYVAANYSPPLADWSGLADFFDMIADGVIEHDYFDLVRDVTAAARALCDNRDPLSTRAPMKISIEAPQLPEVIQRLRLDASLADTWENPTAGDYADGIASWLNDARSGSALEQWHATLIEEADWVAVRDQMQACIADHDGTIDGLLERISRVSLDTQVQRWLLGAALLAGTMYE